MPAGNLPIGSGSDRVPISDAATVAALRIQAHDFVQVSDYASRGSHPVWLTASAATRSSATATLTAGEVPTPAGAAVMVVPASERIDSPELREMLTEVVRNAVRETVPQAVRDEIEKAGLDRPSLADKLTIIGFPLFVGGRSTRSSPRTWSLPRTLWLRSRCF